MHTHASLPVLPADLRNAVLSNYTTIGENGTLCYVADRVHRSCGVCGTVFAGTASGLVLGGGQPCPFCGTAGAAPLPEGWLS
ncbi:hypothetical protein [Solidesulfovibrio sp.]